MTIRTALLEARLLWGDAALYDEFDASATTAKSCSGTGREFVAAKLAERDAAPHRAGRRRATSSSPTSRKARAACATCTRCSGSPSTSTACKDPRSWSTPGCSPEECSLFQQGRGLPLGGAVPHALPHRPGRGAPDLRPPARDRRAPRLASASPASRAVERFMKHYFLVAKDVGDLTAHLLRRAGGRGTPSPRRGSTGCSDGFAGARKRELAGTPDFVVDNDRLSVADDDVFERDPVNMLRLFRSPTSTTCAIHPDATAARHPLAQADRRGAAQATPRPTGCSSSMLTSAATSRDDPAADERGRRARPLHPRIRPHRRDDAVQHVPPLHGGRAPHPLHRHARRASSAATAEGRASAVAHEILPRHQQPRRCCTSRCCCTTSPRAGRRTIRSPARAIARKLCPRLGLSPKPRPRPVAWLVEHHLLMSTSPQSRDLADRKTIETFAAVVQTLERLKMLLVLTVCDIRGGRPRRLERLEGPAAAHALLRDRARAGRRALRRSIAPERVEARAGRAAPGARRLDRRPRSTPISRATTRPTG